MVTVSSSTSTTTTQTASSAAATAATDAATLGSTLVTSLGSGTGIDMTALATTIANAQYAGQASAVTTRLSKTSVQISQASQLKSNLLALQTSLGSLIDGGNLIPAPTVTNSSVASATLPIGSAGSTSPYSLEVTQLAKPQVLGSGNIAAATTMKGGTLSFTFGTAGTTTDSNGNTVKTFTPDTAHAAASVTIADGATLAQAASAINAAGIGVTAYVASNANGQQLVIKGSEGAANGFSITSSDNGSATGATSLAALGYDPTAASSPSSLVQSSGDAAYKLDGISRTATSNTIPNAAPGLSLKLTGTNSGNPTTITYSDPSANITTTMTNLVSALNELVTEMNSDLAPSTGGLFNDSGAKAMAKALGGLAGKVIMPGASGTEPKTLSDLGLSVARDGTFSLDTTKLNKALNTNGGAVAAMFTKGASGVYSTIFTMVQGLTTSTDPGSLAGSISRYTKLQTTLSDQQTTIAGLQTKLRERLVTQYAAANSSVANSNSTLTYLKNQIAAWNKSGT
jgi:flagellar hook-associated protein 2